MRWRHLSLIALFLGSLMAFRAEGNPWNPWQSRGPSRNVSLQGGTVFCTDDWQPTNFTATPSYPGTVDFAWTDNAADEAGFRIYWCEGANCQIFEELHELAADATSDSQTLLTIGTTYRYIIRAFRTGPAYSCPKLATATISPISAPSNLVATASSDTVIGLTWDDNSSAEDGFYIERCSGVSCSNFSTINTTAANAESYSNTGLTAETSYSYRVRGFNAYENTSYSNTATDVTDPTPPFPDAVFSVDLASSIVPETGTAGSFTRATAGTYYDVNGGVQSQSSGNPRFSYPDPSIVASGYKAPGLLIENKCKNLLQYSEAPATSPWALVGGASAADAVGTWNNGTVSYGTFTAASGGDGIEQTGIVSINNLETYVTCSLDARVSSGTQAITLQVSGSGATPQTTTASRTVTTTQAPYQIYKQFSNAVTGNLAFRITSDGAKTIEVSKMHCSYTYAAGDGGYQNRAATQCQYQPTTSAAVTTNRDVLTYSGTELTSLGNTWSVAFWYWTPQNGDYTGDVNALPILLYADDGTKFPGLNLAASTFTFLVDNTGNKYQQFNVASGAMPTRTKFDHYVITANYDTGTFKLYKDGVEKTPSATSIASLGTHTVHALGFGSTGGDTAHGIIRKVHVYDEALDATQADTLFDNEKATFGQ